MYVHGNPLIYSDPSGNDIAIYATASAVVDTNPVVAGAAVMGMGAFAVGAYGGKQLEDDLNKSNGKGNDSGQTDTDPALNSDAQPSTEQDNSGEESSSGKKIHEGKQGKHQPGHNNFDPARGRSELTHPDPQELLDKGAGKGKKHGNKEVVDFGEDIGNFVDKETGKKAPTSRGTIHYDSGGKAHIVPARPALYPQI